MPLTSTTSGEKLGLVETCNPYDVALAEACQLNVGLVEIPVVLFAGEVSFGFFGGGWAVPTRGTIKNTIIHTRRFVDAFIFDLLSGISGSTAS